MFYGDDTVMGYDEDQFMKTMRILTSAHQYNDLQHHRHHHQPSPTQQNLEHQQQQRQRQQQEHQRQIHQQQLKQKQQQQQQKTQVAEKKQESISLENIKDDTKTKEATPAAENAAVEELEIINNEEASSSAMRPPVLTKEDKRRRNTQASARFRVKKKLREQVLQNTANEMTEKANRLQSRVHELEREVQWLKALVVEKKDSRFFTH
jgi:hypothetical protein